MASIFKGKETVKLSGNASATAEQTDFIIQGSPRDVLNYSRDGNDLSIQMKNGRVHHIQNYGANGFDFNDLVFYDGSNKVVVNLGPAVASVGDGILDGLVAETATSASLSTAALLGILGAGGGGLAALGAGGSSDKGSKGSDDIGVYDAPTLSAVIDDIGDITGAIANNGITNDTSPLITGNVANFTSGMSLEIMRDGMTIGTATVLGNSWTFQDSNLQDGVTYTYAARVVDSSGGKSFGSEEITITVDTTAPSAPTILQMSNDTGTQDDFISATATTIISGNADANAIVEIKVGHETAYTVIADSKGVWQSHDIDLSGLAIDEKLAIAVRSYDSVGNSAAAAADFGITHGQEITLTGRTTDGTNEVDFVAGTNLADSLTGGGGADVLLGYGDDDTLTVSDTNFRRIDGGAGNDTLILSGAGLHLDFTALASDVVTNIETIDITGTGANTITLTTQDLLDLSSTTDILKINGSADDTVEAYGFTNSAPDEISGSTTYKVYTNGSATLWIDNEITQISTVIT